MSETENLEPNETKSTEEEINGLPPGRDKAILKKIEQEIKDDDGLDGCWKDIVSGSTVMHDGKKYGLIKMVKHIRGKTQLPEDMNLATVRSKEIELGNLLQIITTELALARHGRNLFAEQKKDYMATAKDRRKSQAMIESELAQFNEEFRYVRGIWMSADLNYQFWDAMHSLVVSTLDRLKQISITLSTESRMDQYMNQNVPTKRGDRV